jgi:hypothetical protein
MELGKYVLLTWRILLKNKRMYLFNTILGRWRISIERVKSPMRLEE